MLPFVQIFCQMESVTKQENGVQISSQSVKLFLLLSCFLFYSFFRCICSKMICLNPGLIWVKLNSKQLCLRFWSQLIVKSVMRVDLSYIFQSDLVTRLKPNFRIEDVEATVLQGCNHVLVLIAGFVGKYVKILNSIRVAERRERFQKVPESMDTFFPFDLFGIFQESRKQGHHFPVIVQTFSGSG